MNMYLFVFLPVVGGMIMLCLLILHVLIKRKPISLNNSHVIITGGSSGIGKALALQAAKEGAKVTIVARNVEKLRETQEEIEAEVKVIEKGSKIQTISVDLATNFDDVEKKFTDSQSRFGPALVLFNCAGGANPGRFDEVPTSDFQKMLNVNFLSAVNATRAVLPIMKKRREGRIVFVSSQAGQIGLFGFTAYSASKFALRGLAESLQMEIKPYNIHITMGFPPDTDTPGFANEQTDKPEETRLISETAGLFTPATVASKLLSAASRGDFLCPVGLDGMMLATLTAGFAPATSALTTLFDALAMGIFRIIAVCYLIYFDHVIKGIKIKRDAHERSKKDD